MFWGVTIHPDRKYSQLVEMNYHISMAALEIDLTKPNETKRVQLILEQDKSKYLLCNLDSEHNQVPLDLIFSEGENVCFYLNGDGVVHLTGYIVDNFSDTDSELDMVENVASKRQYPTDMAKSKLAGDGDLDEEDSDEDVFENDLEDEDLDDEEDDIDEDLDEEDDEELEEEETKSTPKRPMVQNGQEKSLTEAKSADQKGNQEQKSKMAQQQPQGVQQNKFGNQNQGKKFQNQKFGGQNNSNQFNHNNKRKGFTPGGNKGNKFNKNKKGRFSMG